ncbi:restriction endonuclease subunit S [Komagataeibacter diospyri]|uniref:Type I DNA specificity S subunit n=1 Tax=Komagataeibacter diospyri TaxID=1932662 RepID=A0A4P5NZV8_9PROT|nr:restriction endonuclease subunit S [Komagataeibacter diospyri]GCE85205.1 type I DNA specificity S subunit [Komagataeibacter diospyri]
MSKELWDILPSWTWAEIENVGRVVSGGTPSTKEASYWGKEIVWFSPADLSGYKTKYIARGAKFLSRKGLVNCSAQIMPKGTVMFSSRAPIGYVAITSVEAATNQGFKSIVPADGVFNEYLYYYLKAAKYVAEERATGTTFKEISGSAFAKMPVPVAPTNEQRRIVAKIEELFSELDKGVESLTTAREQLKAYRQSVLRAAFEGKLTEGWRKQHPELPDAEALRESLSCARSAQASEQKKRRRTRKLAPVTPLTSEVLETLPDIPSEWVWEKLGWLTCGVEYGTSAKSSKSGRVPVVRMGNIQNGVIDWDNLVFTDDAAEIAKYSLCSGDVLFNRTNSPELVGKTAIYRGERSAIYAGYLIRINHNEAIVDSDYLNFFLNSHSARSYGNSVKTDGVNQSNINGEKLQSYPFPYCSLAEQQEIVRILQRQLSLCDSLFVDVESQLNRSDTLRRAILKRAFSGQLVPQDDRDEPASVLLKRIRAEQDEGKKKKPRSRNNRRKEAA